MYLANRYDIPVQDEERSTEKILKKTMNDPMFGGHYCIISILHMIKFRVEDFEM